MGMKKYMLAFCLAGLMAAPVCAENLWQYNDYTQVDMETASVKMEKGMKVLRFDTIETIGDSVSYCKYVYNVDEQTIQLEEMRTKTKKSEYVSNFWPEKIQNGNKVIQDRADMANAVLAKKENK